MKENKLNNKLLPHHIDHLATSGITEETAEKAGVRSITDQNEARKLLNWKGGYPPIPGIWFPYSDNYGRYRPDNPRVEEDKLIKYEGPSGIQQRPYIIPGSKNFIQQSDIIYLIEGEKKALTLYQSGFAVIAGSGVWGFHNKREKTDPFELHDSIVELFSNEQKAVICFDSDMIENENVLLAAIQLIQMLNYKSISSYIITLPTNLGKGIDDIFVSLNKDKIKLKELLEENRKKAVIEPLSVKRIEILIKELETLLQTNKELDNCLKKIYSAIAWCSNLTKVDMFINQLAKILKRQGVGKRTITKEINNSQKYLQSINIKKIVDNEKYSPTWWLKELNGRYTVIRNFGGKCQVVEEISDSELNRPFLSNIDFDNFKKSLSNKKIITGYDANNDPVYLTNNSGIPISAGDWWLDHEDRNQREKVVFVPNKNTPNDYNLWKGFGVGAVEGDCQMFLDHIKEVICNNNEECYNYLIKWMARAVQQPETQGHVAVVLRSPEQGTGKGTFVRNFGGIFGRHYSSVTNSKHLVGRFNFHLKDCCLLFCDEAFFAGDKSSMGILKGLITEPTVRIEPKGVNSMEVANHLHIIMASNNDWIVPAEKNERRFFVLDVAINKTQDISYFKRMDFHMENGGREALLYYLLHVNISDFIVWNFPQTDALRDQKILSFNSVEKWWHSKLDMGDLPYPTRPSTEKKNMEIIPEWGDPLGIPRKDLQEDYILHAQKEGVSRRAAEIELGKFLRRALPDEFNITRERYIIPSLEKCRLHWGKVHSVKFEWSKQSSEFSFNLMEGEEINKNGLTN